MERCYLLDGSSQCVCYLSINFGTGFGSLGLMTSILVFVSVFYFRSACGGGVRL